MSPHAAAEVRVLVLPVFRRYWLWHAWKVEAPASSSRTQTAPTPQQQAHSVQERLQLLLKSIQRWGSRQGEQQWHKIATAPEGTFNHRLFRLAQEVLSRVDPNESFLKVLPQQAQLLQFRYPSSLPERLVRRRLRLLAAKAQPFHASRLRLWSAAIIPQIPLIPLPLPNVTIYFTLWRIISNRSAGKGAAALAEALDHLGDVQRLQLAQQLVALQQQGVQLKPGSWSAELAAEAYRLQQKVQAEQGTIQRAPESSSSSTSSSSNGTGHHQHHQPPPHQQQQQQQQEHKGLPLPVFVADQELDQLVQPHSRLTQFLPEAVAEKLVQLYQQPHLLEHYRAAKKTCEAASSSSSSARPPY